MTRFNPKVYLNKKRIEKAVKGNPGISKIWVWDELKQEYLPPLRGKPYLAVRKRISGKSVVEEKRAFENIDLARAWKYETVETVLVESTENNFPLFQDVILEYENKRINQLRPSTQESYRKMLKNYFSFLKAIRMNEITPGIIDDWIDFLKSLPRTERRKSFEHEFNLLSAILKFYAEFDDTFESPIKPRHRKNIRLQSFKGSKSKFLTPEEFFKFRAELLNGPNGILFWTMSTVQFFQALRISEAAGLFWEDVKWDTQNIENSQLHVSRSVFFSRQANTEPEILNSFKNSKSNNGLKVAPLLKESCNALLDYGKGFEKKGQIFKQPDGKLLTYRQIQNAYDSAFKRAGLPYSGTHVMRHGGASYVYNESNGDLSLVQSITGNRDLKTVLVYSHRSPIALTEFAKKTWEK